MAKAKLGSGKRFAQMRRSGMSGALSAWIGRKKYGSKRMAKMAAAGRRRHNRQHEG